MGGELLLDFSLGRKEGFPTRYEDHSSAAHIDVLTSGLITAFVLVALSFFAIIPAYSRLRRVVLVCRLVCSFFIGGVIVVGNYGHNWEKGVIQMSTPYKPGVPDEVHGTIGLHISLRGFNITLTGGPQDKRSTLAMEKIDYNEHFSWEWAQGRFGFGPYAGRVSQDFRAAVIRGVPIPILQIAEYFTFDGEGIRFGRHYRLAGWYSHQIMWFAFGTWLITNILFCMVVRTAALFLFFTGCLQVAAVAVWAELRNPIEISIPFQTYDGKHDISLRTEFGLDFYLVLANGLFCMALSALITLLDSCIPDEMCQCFGIDPLTIYDELLLSKDEIKEEKKRISMSQGKPKLADVELQVAGVSIDPSGGGVDVGDPQKDLFLRRRDNPAGSLLRRSFRQIKPRIPRRTRHSPGYGSGEHRGSAADLSIQRPLLQKRLSTSDDDEDVVARKTGEQTSSSLEVSWPPPLPAKSGPSSPSLIRKAPPPPPPR